MSDAGWMSWGRLCCSHDATVQGYQLFASHVAQQDHHELPAFVCMHILVVSLRFRGTEETKPAMYGLISPPRTGRIGEGSAPGLPGAQPLRQQLRGPWGPVHVVGPVAGCLPEPARALLPRGLLRVSLLLLRRQRLCRVRPSTTYCGVLRAPCRDFTRAQMPWL